MRLVFHRPLPITARRGALRFPALLAALMAMLLAACTATASPWVAPSIAVSPAPSTQPSPTSTPAPTFPLSLTDDENNRVTIAIEPRRIVSLTPAATEILFALGVGDRLVGKVEDFAVYPPAAAAVADVAKYGSVDVERIVALNADLVIAGGNQFNPPAEVARLRGLGMPVLVVYGPSLQAALADMELIGQATARTLEARDLVAGLRAQFDQVQAASRSLARPRVYYELDATNGYFGPAPDYFGVEMIQLAGGEPLTSGIPGVFQIPEERIVAFDPEVILLGDAAYGVTAAQVAARPAWARMSAVRTGAIRPVDDIVITRPGPRLGEGLLALARAIHPGAALPGPSGAPSPGPATAPAASSIASPGASPLASATTRP